jgi:hypothetical protein
VLRKSFKHHPGFIACLSTQAGCRRGLWQWHAGDQLLTAWRKESQVLIEYPPANMPLVGWRDPFIFEFGGDGRGWGMLMGSGIKNQGGAVMIYRSESLRSGACRALSRATGLLVKAAPRVFGAAVD